MSAGVGIFVCIVVTFIIIPGVALSIASLIVAVNNQDATCDDNSFISLSTWLIVFASVNFGILFAIVIAGVACISSKGAGIAIYIITIIVSTLWTIAWNIVGAVALFRDSMDCLDQTSSIWGMTLAVLILQWISIFQNCCTGGGAKSVDA